MVARTRWPQGEWAKRPGELIELGGVRVLASTQEGVRFGGEQSSESELVVISDSLLAHKIAGLEKSD